METIIFHDLSELSNRAARGAKLKENQMGLYVHVRGDGKLGTHNLTFGGLLNEYNFGYKFMNVAENTLTGEIFLVFTKEKGVELSILKGGIQSKKDGKSRGKLGTQKNNVVKFLCEKLNLKTNQSLNLTFDLSNNLSKNDENLTFKILQK